MKPPEYQQEKQKYFHSLWHQDDWLQKNISNSNEFDYSQIDSVKVFSKTHPSVMQSRIAQTNWKINIDPSKKKLSLKSRIKISIEKLTGWLPGEYKNYKLLK